MKMEDGIVVAYEELSKEELLQLKSELEAQFDEVKAKNLKLDMSRGKPSTEQLNLSMDMMDVLKSDSDLVCEEGVDCRNYGCSGWYCRSKTVACRYDGSTERQYRYLR